ncbi:MAG: bifunctional diguanylate cyclase/phosphodiesterase [Myxococcales bacterium]|nr:bifunctional diguanylate cyclase/phosphodiesterase [Myxococcales bacterium]
MDGALHVWMHDINDRQEALEALRRSALFDSLTSLPNLTLFRDLITERLARTPSEGVTLIMLQLDGLQIVNTSFGRDAADVVLMSAVSRLRDLVRPPAILARIGNQRFAALLTDPPDELAAMREAETIRKALSAPIQHGEMSVVLSHCIGIAVAAEDSRDADDLMQHAEAALARARSIGKNRTELFAREMHLEIRRRLEVEADLRGALERREFRLYYQPLVSLASGEVVGFEALVRWQHPARGLIAPGEFISVAEESELIVPLGRWVLNEGLRQLSCWSAEHDAFAGMRLSVNVSPVQFAGDDFLEVVDAALAQTGIEPRRLVLELTESVLMRDAERTHELFTKLRGRGVRLAMDDFGTGYSSLSYMQRFTMDSLKIDRAFIDGLEGDRQKLAIVKTILSLSDNFEMTTTAEGIETRDQLEIVVDLGCQFGQGYFLARPTPASEIPTLIQRWHPEKGRTTTGTQR